MKIKTPTTLRFSLLFSTAAFVYNSFITFVQFFYTDFLQLPASLVGRGWLLFGIWNTANDPLAGSLSDKYKNNVGKRSKLIKILIAPVSLAFFLIWLPEVNFNKKLLFIYFLVAISVFDLLHSFLTVNFTALIPSLFKTLRARTDFATQANILNIIKSGLALSFAPYIYSEFGWRTFGILYAGLGYLFYKYASAKINEKAQKVKGKAIKFSKNLRLLLKKSYFWNVLGISFFARLLLALAMSALPFFVKYSLKVDEKFTGFFIGSLLLAGVAALPLWRKTMIRVGTRKTLLLSCFLSFFSFFLILGDYEIYYYFVVFAVIGSVSIGTQLAPIVINAEVADLDIKTEGIKREGLLFGLLGSAIRFPPALSGFALGEVLTKTGYAASLGLDAIPSSVGEGIKLYLFFGSIVSLCFIALFNYKLNIR